MHRRSRQHACYQFAGVLFIFGGCCLVMYYLVTSKITGSLVKDSLSGAALSGFFSFAIYMFLCIVEYLKKFFFDAEGLFEEILF